MLDLLINFISGGVVGGLVTSIYLSRDMRKIQDRLLDVLTANKCLKDYTEYSRNKSLDEAKQKPKKNYKQKFTSKKRKPRPNKES